MQKKLQSGAYLRRHKTNSILQRKFTQPQCLAPAGQSWAEAGSGVTARNWSLPASSGSGAGAAGLAAAQAFRSQLRPSDVERLLDEAGQRAAQAIEETAAEDARHSGLALHV